MIVLHEDLSSEQADDYALALASCNIPSLSAADGESWKILVYEEDFEYAWRVVEQYTEENPETISDGMPSSRWKPLTFTGVWMAFALLSWHIAAGSGNDREMFADNYAASASAILEGELYRSVTALVLHANAAHLAGNMVGIALFGSAVCQAAGWGAGVFMILMTGISGNIMNAYLYRSDHISVGSSTAVFGAIGILCACRFVRAFKIGENRMRAFLPLCAGLALLGFLGSGPHTDIMAHLFGFVSGIAMGSVYAVFFKKPVSGISQACFFVFSFAVLAASWADGW